MKKFLIVFLILFLPLASFSKDSYIELLDKFYLNTDSVTPNVKTASMNFWVKFRAVNNFYPANVKDSNYVLQNWEISCPNKTFSILVTHIYDKNSNPIDSTYNSFVNEIIVPDTMPDILYSYYCQK